MLAQSIVCYTAGQWQHHFYINSHDYSSISYSADAKHQALVGHVLRNIVFAGDAAEYGWYGRIQKEKGNRLYSSHSRDRRLDLPGGLRRELLQQWRRWWYRHTQWIVYHHRNRHVRSDYSNRDIHSDRAVVRIDAQEKQPDRESDPAVLFRRKSGVTLVFLRSRHGLRRFEHLALSAQILHQLKISAHMGFLLALRASELAGDGALLSGIPSALPVVQQSRDIPHVLNCFCGAQIFRRRALRGNVGSRIILRRSCHFLHRLIRIRVFSLMTVPARPYL